VVIYYTCGIFAPNIDHSTKGESVNYLDILQDREIMAIFNRIDIAKQAEPRHYGVIHTLSTIEYAKQLADVFSLTDKEKELLYIACSLHNLGHLNGKSLHAQTGAEMAKTYLKKHNLDAKDITTICSAISSHLGRRNDNFYDSVSACLILADKMDFGATRIKQYFEPLELEDEVCKAITHVEVKRNNDTVILLLGGNKVNWKVFVQSAIYSKMYRCFETVCKKYDYQFVVKVKKDV